MVEVFKTNVRKLTDAKRLLVLIHERYVHYKANFDLKDCDNILRVQNNSGAIHVQRLVELMEELGFEAEVLPDEVNMLAQ